MKEYELEWHHAGISDISNHGDSTIVRIPDLLFEENILTPGEEACWSYEKTVKCLVVSNRKLVERSEYKHIGSRKVSDGNNRYRCVLPSDLFEDKKRQGNPKVDSSLPEDVQLSVGDRLHFMYRPPMITKSTKSCFAFTDQQFDERFKSSPKWDEELSNVPRFSP